jgi:phenylpropionate dioxygenase-like ring-hydroxylating dioxygenase large terminal subunit
MIPDQWYAIYISSQLKSSKKPIGVTRFGKKLVLWRSSDGKAVCMPDKCCHRKAQLSLGKIKEDCIECPYHGFRYDTEGQVVKIPAQPDGKKISTAYHLTPYILREDKGLIWMWYGLEMDENELPALPWDASFDAEFSANSNRVVFSEDTFDVSYLRLMENATDIFHVPFVHRSFVPPWEKVEDFECTSEGVHVKVQGRLTNGKEDHVGFFTSIHYIAPANLLMCLGEKSNARFIASFAPVDESHMWMCAQYTQDYVRAPLLGKFVSWLLCLFDYRLLQKLQDAPIWRSQQPENKDDIKDYKLIAADKGVAHIFRIRRELIAKAKSRRDKLR